MSCNHPLLLWQLQCIQYEQQESTKLTITLLSESITDWHGSRWAQDRLTKIWEKAPKPLPGRGPEGTPLTHTWLAEGRTPFWLRLHNMLETVNLTMADMSVRDLTVLFPNVLSTHSSNRKNIFHAGSLDILQKTPARRARGRLLPSPGEKWASLSRSVYSFQVPFWPRGKKMNPAADSHQRHFVLCLKLPPLMNFRYIYLLVCVLTLAILNSFQLSLNGSNSQSRLRAVLDGQGVKLRVKEESGL